MPLERLAIPSRFLWNGTVTDDRLLDRLRDAVGDAHVLTDPEVRASYETDWTGRFTGLARCVVRPASTGETSTVVRLCAEAGVPIVPQGGNTGLVGGSVPRGGEVVLSTRRLDQIGEVDLVSGEVVAGAGVTLGALSAPPSPARPPPRRRSRLP